MMDEIDRFFLALNSDQFVGLTIIGCLFTGPKPPSHCAPMPRRPDPRCGMVLDHTFASVVSNALASNRAVHDGAVMIGRPSKDDPYRVVGWSYRLFPPETPLPAEPNRGSAFNSCLAMSMVQTIDRVYLISKDGTLRFSRDGPATLRSTGG